MPEAAIDEYREMVCAENEIGLAGERGMAPPAGNAVEAEQFCQRPLGGQISASPDEGHHVGSLRLGEDICHGRLEIGQTANSLSRQARGFPCRRLTKPATSRAAATWLSSS